MSFGQYQPVLKLGKSCKPLTFWLDAGNVHNCVFTDGVVKPWLFVPVEPDHAGESEFGCDEPRQSEPHLKLSSKSMRRPQSGKGLYLSIQIQL